MDRFADPPVSFESAVPQLLRAAIVMFPLLVAGCATTPRIPARSFAVWGFTAPWDPRSAASVARHAGALDAVVSGWIALDSVTGVPRALFSDSVPAGGRTRRMALVTSWMKDRFHPATVRRLAADPDALAATAREVARLTTGYRGVVLDFEEHTAADLPGLVRVARAIADSVRAHGAGPVVLAIPAVDTVGYPAAPLAAAVDLLLPMLYDLHWSTSGPGPVADPAWVRRALAMRVSEVGAARLVAALPVYGYHWQAGGGPAGTIGMEDAERLAREASVPLRRDPVSASLTAARPSAWELWMSDAEQLRELTAVCLALGVRTIALWRLGLEDPRTWDVLRR